MTARRLCDGRNSYYRPQGHVPNARLQVATSLLLIAQFAPPIFPMKDNEVMPAVLAASFLFVSITDIGNLTHVPIQV